MPIVLPLEVERHFTPDDIRVHLALELFLTPGRNWDRGHWSLAFRNYPHACPDSRLTRLCY